MTFSPEFAKLLQETSMRQPKDLTLIEVSQKCYEEAYEFLHNKYGGAMGRTNLMLNGHLITPILEQAFKARAQVLLEETAKRVAIAKLIQLEDKNELES